MNSDKYRKETNKRISEQLRRGEFIDAPVDLEQIAFPERSIIKKDYSIIKKLYKINEK